MTNVISEHEIQSTFISTCRLAAKADPRYGWIFAIPNAGKRSYKTRCLMLDEGLRAGVSDIFIPYPSSGLHGLFIEFKAPSGKCTAKQIAFGEAMQAAGYGWRVCRSVDEAMGLVQLYLDGSTENQE